MIFGRDEPIALLKVSDVFLWIALVGTAPNWNVLWEERDYDIRHLVIFRGQSPTRVEGEENDLAVMFSRKLCQRRCQRTPIFFVDVVADKVGRERANGDSEDFPFGRQAGGRAKGIAAEDGEIPSAQERSVAVDLLEGSA